MPRYVAHFDETDHMDGHMLGIGGFFTTGGRLPGLMETWEEMRADLEMEDREIRWNNLTWYKREGLAAWVAVMPIWIVADLLLDERGMSDRSARDHYRVGLRWAIARVARVARPEPHAAAPTHEHPTWSVRSTVSHEVGYAVCIMRIPGPGGTRVPMLERQDIVPRPLAPGAR